MTGRQSRSAGGDTRPHPPADRGRRRPGADPARTAGADRLGPPDPRLDRDPDPESVARTIALGLLERQPRTRAELSRALARRGVPVEAATAVLDRFTEVGLVDDAAFAAAWVDSRHTGRRLARRALAAELRRRGVDAQTAHAALASVTDEDEVAAARALVARRLPATAGLARDVRVRRLAGMLARKGFGEGLALRVVREALADDGDD